MNFFKYTTIDTAKIVLENETLRWSSPLLFNDIEECQFTPFTEEQHALAFENYYKVLVDCAKGRLFYDYYRFSEITHQLISAVKLMIATDKLDDFDYSELLDLIDNPKEGHREYINKGLVNVFRILCVTTEYDNPLMWAHYGDQHYGCALEFEKLYEDKPRKLKEGFVRYHDNLEPLSNPMDMLLFGETEEVHNLMLQDIIFSKRTFWSYEKEYRLMFAESYGQISTSLNFQSGERTFEVSHQTDEQHTDIPFPFESLKSITFGARTQRGDIERILTTLQEKQYYCDLYQFSMVDGVPSRQKLDLEQYSVSKI
ncbi:DUF2971 domain-containing protein [Photobacterium leiognathi]|uniref:DUF2971 domain-containing protein n=1 Tax=Photobacterium leiognathi TaxID=553611 RepID=UPI00076A10BA|nr:DUF2971 domain-containing protein [Photobacterium leiognathi]